MLVSIMYFSGTGHTARQALAVADGIRRAPDVEARVIDLAIDDEALAGRAIASVFVLWGRRGMAPKIDHSYPTDQPSL